MSSKQTSTVVVLARDDNHQLPSAGYLPMSTRLDLTGVFMHNRRSHSASKENPAMVRGTAKRDWQCCSASTKMARTCLSHELSWSYEALRCLKNLKKYLYHYEHNCKAWMKCDMLERFLVYLNSWMGYRNLKVLLFLDNFSTHPKKTAPLRNIPFLLVSITSKFQPLDDGIKKCVKHLYRKCVMWLFLAKKEQSVVPRKLTLLGVVHYVTESWESMSATAQYCFQKCGFVTADSIDAAPCIDEGGDKDMEAAKRAPFSYRKFVSLYDIVFTIRRSRYYCRSLSDECWWYRGNTKEQEETPTFANTVAAQAEARNFLASNSNLCLQQV